MKAESKPNKPLVTSFDPLVYALADPTVPPPESLNPKKALNPGPKSWASAFTGYKTTDRETPKAPGGAKFPKS